MSRIRRSSLTLRLAAALLAGFLIWNLALRSGDAASNSRQASCPVHYPRIGDRDLRSGRRRPYLLGGISQRPGCTNCARTGGWADICQFKGGQLCAEGLYWTLLQAWLERGHELALQLSPCDLWGLLHGRTLWLVGDSQMLDFYKAVQCFLFEFWPSLAQRNVSDVPALQQQLSAIIRATCADLLGGTAVCYIRVDKGGDLVERVLPLLADGPPGLVAPSRDVMVVNFGLHHGPDTYAAALSAFAEYAARHAAALPRLLWQPTPAQHFAASPSGEYPGGSPPFRCARPANFSVVGDGVAVLEEGKSDPHGLLRGGWRNAAAAAAMAAAHVPVLPSFNESLWMDTFHRDNGGGWECTHFCHPSAPQSWVIALYRMLRALPPPPPLGSQVAAAAKAWR